MGRTPHGVSRSASLLFAFRLSGMLIDKGLLTQQEAAKIMVETANDLRSGTEDGETAQDGEAVARGFEHLAAWLLGQNPKL